MQQQYFDLDKEKLQKVINLWIYLILNEFKKQKRNIHLLKQLVEYITDVTLLQAKKKEQGIYFKKKIIRYFQKFIELEQKAQDELLDKIIQEELHKSLIGLEPYNNF